MPDIPPGKLRDLIERLHHLYKRAGMPGLRRIARKTRFSHTAVYSLFTLERSLPPNQELMFDVVQALLEMRRRGDAGETEATLDWFDQAWMAALEDPFDQDAAEASPAAAPEEPTSASVEVAAAGANGNDVAKRITAWSERVLETPALAAKKRNAAITRALERFGYLGRDGAPRYRKVEIILWKSAVIDEVLTAVAELAEFLWVGEQKLAGEDWRIIKLYVLVHGWDDIGFWCAVEDAVQNHNAQLVRVQHVASPAPMEMDILTLIVDPGINSEIAAQLGISVEDVRAFRSKAPRAFKVKTVREAVDDAIRFRLIPTSVASRGWHGYL